ncbi:MAG: glycosyltransferase, partial [Candidatus Limnocylindrales bacterium]
LDGRRTRAQVIAALGDADLLVAPSVVARNGKREGIPVVLMEAMSCGLPVVASRLSGIPELVDDGENGSLVTPGDPVALADAIARLAADPGLRARMGAAARTRIERDFDLVANARAILERIADADDARSPEPAGAAARPRPDPRLTPRPTPGDQP